MMLIVTKTDKVDAQLVPLYGEKMQPTPYIIPSPNIQTLKQQQKILNQLKKQLTISYNLLESFSVLPKVDALAIKALKKTIAFLEEQIAFLERKEGHINRHGPPAVFFALYGFLVGYTL